MYNNDPIQQSNLVSDDAAAAMSDPAVAEPIQPQTQEPEIVQPQTTPTPTAPAKSATMEAAAPVVDTAPAASTATDGEGDELETIKKQALDQLQPLIQHVEQSPEERFETIMMMIRSNDDTSLISQAYEAAGGIQDEKIKANALLNIVSEIEYQKSKSNA